MIKTFTYLFTLLFLLSIGFNASAQNIITQWNFNSVPPDASTTTGSLIASTGSGSISNIGGTTTTFASGTANGGSSDPATIDNTGWNLTGFPAISSANSTAGIQFAVSTVGRTNIVVTFDLRHSNTSSRYEQFQYTTDISAAIPVWVDFALFDATPGDAWYRRTANLSTVTALNNNANAAFRIVSAFAPSITSYAASSTTYATTGTWRFDMVTVNESPALIPATLAFVGANATVAETAGSFNINALLTNGNASPSSVDLEILPVFTATSGSDYVAPTMLQYSWPANSNSITQSLNFTINNDALPENTEYITVRFVNPVNLTLPSGNNNVFTLFISDNDKLAPATSTNLQLNPIASFSNGTAGTNSAEIVAHDPITQRLFIANSIGAKIDIVDFSNPASPVLINSINVTPYGNINSVAVKNGVLACAIENANPQLPGKVVFFNTDGVLINQVDVGTLPDMILFSADGNKVLTANEGEPNAAYTIDPEGSVSVIDISGGVASITNANVTNIGFTSFNSQVVALRASGVRIFGPGATVAQDMEPEYITLSSDGLTAYVVCQENNAMAIINLTTNTVTEIRALGTKDHSLTKNSLDVSDQSGVIQIANWPIKGLYMPDGITSFNVAGQDYLVTANEGDAREYTGYSEIVRFNAASYVLDPTVFPNPEAIKTNLGRLNVTLASGDIDSDGDYDEIHVYGARSFSIWNATTGALVWDSGEDFELITSKHPTLSALFNASNSNNTFKNRSDDKGPEPEGVVVADIAGRKYAFVALERIGGCMVYDVTNPASPVFIDYKNTRTLGSYGGDNGAEGIIFISAVNSPNAQPIVILANEVSSTLAIYSLTGTVLPIKLSNIAAVNEGSKNIISWQTATEAIGDAFELESSKDAVNFQKITSIPARGLASTYQFEDLSPYQGINYYRLRMKNIDGYITYSDIVNATVSNKQNSLFTIFPNPVQNSLQLSIPVPQTGAYITVVDYKGAVLIKKLIAGNSTRIDVSMLAAGNYLINYYTKQGIETIKFIKD